MTASESRGLGRIAAERGTAVACAGNLPVEISDPEFVWFIESGAVDVFLIERRDGVEESAPQHMLRADAGRLLPGTARQEDDTSLGLIAKGLPGTVLRRLPVARLDELPSLELAEQIDAWVTDVSSMLVRDVDHQPRMDALLEPGEAPTTRSGSLAARRSVVWVSDVPRGAGLFLDLIDPGGVETDAVSNGHAVPLTPATWLTLNEERRVSTHSSRELAERNLLLSALSTFNAVAFQLERVNRLLAVADQANLAREGGINRLEDEERARRRLFDLYGLADAAPEGADDAALHEVLSVIGRHAGIVFRPARETEPSTREASPAATLAKVLRASGVRGRRVRLAPEDRWWVGDSGAMLAFRVDNGRPVALLPGRLGNYREVDPRNGRSRRITAATAASLRPEAWMFYPRLGSAAVGWRDLRRVAAKGFGADVTRFVVAGLLGGLVALLPALAIGFVADEVVPLRDVGLLYGICVALAAFGLVRAVLHVFQGMTLMRFEGRATSRMEAAFWDRLLRLPSEVLRRHPASDLAARGMTFQGLRDAAQGVIGNGVLSVIFLAPAFLLIASRNAVLGALTAAFGLLSLFATVTPGLRQISPHRRRLRAIRRLSARLFQLINGISKLRVEGAEGSAFAVWARDYRKQKRAELELGAIEAHQQAFGSALPLLAAALLVLAVTFAGPDALTIGDFIVVYVLFLLYQTAVVRLGESFSAFAAAGPALSQIRPILSEAVEAGTEGERVEMLGGDVALDRVSFRYDADGPLILDDVSIQARTGEFVAIVGESGAGKSTLFKVLLGLERPSSGSVYFDGRDLHQLDPVDVRRHVGVVPQKVQLHPQDLWDNIVGDHEDVTEEDVWGAARLAAVDQEIAAMPMGMLTPVGQGAAVTSGGESQRVRIAHALLSDPRVLLLDEATNWLDNETQSKVLANLAGLTSTRIVIAHRLSTLREADRIYVLRKGRVVQEGTFTELAATPGVFQDMVRRQTA